MNGIPWIQNPSMKRSPESGNKQRVLGLGLMLSSLILVFPAVGLSWDQAEKAQFGQANRQYREGRFDEAISVYESLLSNHPESAVLYYNLANSYFRKGAIGKSLLAYERSRLLSPRDRDTRFNLDYVRGLLEYRIEDKRIWFIGWGEKILEQFTDKEIGLLCLGIYFLFISSCLFVLYFRRGLPWGWKRQTLLTLALVAVILGLAKHIETQVIRDAIVMAKQAEVRYGPSESDRVAFRLSEGLKVHVVDRREDWSRVILVNGEGGWMRNTQIAEVRM